MKFIDCFWSDDDSPPWAGRDAVASATKYLAKLAGVGEDWAHDIVQHMLDLGEYEIVLAHEGEEYEDNLYAVVSRRPRVIVARHPGVVEFIRAQPG